MTSEEEAQTILNARVADRSGIGISQAIYHLRRNELAEALADLEKTQGNVLKLLALSDRYILATFNQGKATK